MFHVKHFMETLTNCPVCAANTFDAYLTCKDYTVSGEEFRIVNCTNCGFKFTNPRPEEEKLGAYYKSEEYVSHSNTNKGIINKLYKIVRSYTLGSKLKIIDKRSIKGSLLDYGCGTGMFLAHAKSSTWNVTGIEPDLSARSFAIKENNLNVFADERDLEKEFPNTQFNCITLWHVLEHIPHLGKTLTWLSAKLEQNGTLVIAVPNYTSYDAVVYGKHWAAFDVPRHLYHFNIKSINELLVQYGFILQETLPMKFDSFYVSMLSEKYKHGKPNLIRAFLTGLQSNFKATSASGYSSVIYVFKKA